VVISGRRRLGRLRPVPQFVAGYSGTPLATMVRPDGGLWIVWPKRSSGVTTDVTDDVVRGLALPRGLVDNKVCAVDTTWTGLRIVWRVRNR